MCLLTVTWQAKTNSGARNKSKWVIGYKVFDVDKNIIKFPHYGIGDKSGSSRTYTQEVVLNKIYKAEQKDIYINDFPIIPKYTKYKSGFHIFPVAIACKLFNGIYKDRYSNIFEVKYKNVTAIGIHAVHTQYPVDCIIAREMRVTRCLSITEIEEILKNEEKIMRNDIPRRR